MSSRDPLWFCYECNSEMRPIMVPEPQCPSCNSSFVEKIENPADDPREFRQDAGEIPAEMLDPMQFFASLHELLPPPRPRTESPAAGQRSQPSLRFEFGAPGSQRSVNLGGPNTLLPGIRERDRITPTSPPLLSNYLRRGEAEPRPSEARTIPGDLMTQYLLSFLNGGHQAGGNGSPHFLQPFGLGPDRMGDYVFTQEALDHIMTQLMEGASSSRPVPATDELIEDLPREVLEEKSPLLEKECAVCKDQFSTASDDPDNLVVVTLPCAHPFHESCIVPWLKSSGTCPVCRHALIPQPNRDGGNPIPGQAPRGSGSRANSLNNNADNSFRNLGNPFAHLVSRGSNSRGNTSPRNRERANSDSYYRGPNDNTPGSSSRGFPGGWDDSE